LLILYSST